MDRRALYGQNVHPAAFIKRVSVKACALICRNLAAGMHPFSQNNVNEVNADAEQQGLGCVRCSRSP